MTQTLAICQPFFSLSFSPFMSPVFVFCTLFTLSLSLLIHLERHNQHNWWQVSANKAVVFVIVCLFLFFSLRRLGRWCNLSFFQFSLFVFSCSCSVITTVTLFLLQKKKERQATLHNHQPRAVHSFGRQSWCAWCAAVVVRHHHQLWVALLWI